MKLKNYFAGFVLLSTLFIIQSAYAQGSDYLDYMVTRNNDTIYGTYTKGRLRYYLQEYNREGKTFDERYIKHSLKDAKAYRINGFVSTVEMKGDGVYTADMVSNDADDFSKDYVVTNSGDTIFSRVYERVYGSPYYIKEGGTKQKIKSDQYSAYRRGDFSYEYREKPKAFLIDSKHAFLFVLYKKDKITLYGYRDDIGMCYYLDKGDGMKLINGKIFAEHIQDYLGDNLKVMNFIYTYIYKYENLYLAVKYYAERPYSG